MLWFIVVACVVAYCTYLVAGSIVNAQASSEYQPILVRDELGAGVHHLSGMIMVPTPCHELILRTEKLSETAHVLSFRTWEEPSRKCERQEVPRHFRTVLFAPSAGVEFIATLAGVGLPITVLPVTPADK